MRTRFPLLLFICLLAGCNIPRFGPTPETAVPSLPYTQCAWTWATQALPELSTKVEAGMQTAGLKDVTARAEAYGENCITTGGKVDHFAAMETDFRIAVQVGNLKDTDELGSLLEKILTVLDGFPTESTPGPNPGYVGVSFQKGSEELNMWFPVTAGKSARALGHHGAALFEELQKK
jgi:hypothetical protein